MGNFNSINSDSLYELEKYCQNTRKYHSKDIEKLIKQLMLDCSKPLCHIKYKHINLYTKKYGYSIDIVKQIYLFFFNYNRYCHKILSKYGNQKKSSKHYENVALYRLCIYQLFIDVDPYIINPYIVYDKGSNPNFELYRHFIDKNTITFEDDPRKQIDMLQMMK